MKQTIFIILVIAGMFFVASLIVGQQTHANQQEFLSCQSLATATTTLTYLTPGLATTTLNLPDAYNNGANKAFDQAYLYVQNTASSTASVLNVAIEHSLNNIDWFRDNALDTAGVSTTTFAADITTDGSYKWTFASSTQGGNSDIGSTTGRKAIKIPLTSRYTRAVFTNTGAGLGLWASACPIRQVHE